MYNRSTSGAPTMCSAADRPAPCAALFARVALLVVLLVGSVQQRTGSGRLAIARLRLTGHDQLQA